MDVSGLQANQALRDKCWQPALATGVTAGEPWPWRGPVVRETARYAAYSSCAV